MPVLALLLSPRGAVRRRAFWLGLFLLALVEIALYAALAGQGAAPAALLPAIGPWALAIDGPLLALDGRLANLAIIALQAWISGVLCLKRLRDIGRGPRALIVVWLADLALSGAIAAKLFDIARSGVDTHGMAAFAVVCFGAGLAGLLWLGFLAWLGLSPSRVKPLS